MTQWFAMECGTTVFDFTCVVLLAGKEVLFVPPDCNTVRPLSDRGGGWFGQSIKWCTMDCWVDAGHLRMAVLDCGSQESPTVGYL